MSSADLKRLKTLEKEHRHMKQMYATLSMDHEPLREVLEKNWGQHSTTSNMQQASLKLP
jgi:putative transposase